MYDRADGQQLGANDQHLGEFMIGAALRRWQDWRADKMVETIVVA